MEDKMLNIVKSSALAAILGCITLVGHASADSYNRRIVLVNHTSDVITNFYASNVGTIDWQEDLLGNSILLPGESVRINIDDGSGYCRFDFMTVTEGGEVAIRPGVNVCELASYTLMDA
jgi:hypothetical protein